MSYFIGIGLVLLAFLLFGKGIVRRSQGKSFNPLPVLGLILVAVLFHVFAGELTLTQRLGRLFLDFGLGMALAALYLAAKKQQAKLFWVPGVLAMVLGGVVTLFSFGLNYCDNMQAEDNNGKAELLVELGPDDHLHEIQHILNRYDATAERAFPEVDMDEDVDLAQYYLIYVDSMQAEMLNMALEEDRENVDQSDYNRPIYLHEPLAADALRRGPGQYLANDPFLGKQWFAAKLQYNAIHELLKEKQPKKKVKIAIVDTGVDQDHEDIEGVYTKSGGDGDHDNHSHGTHCAGLAGAATNNGKGVGSLNWNGEFLSLTGFPALDAQGRGTDRRVAQAIIQAAESGADVISMSLGGFSPMGPPKAQADAIKYARKLGAIVVVAAGNSNLDARRFSPANAKGVIVVGAVDENFNKAFFSNTNTKLKMPIAAPGVNILSSTPGSEYQAFNGTSMATPIVAGLVGMLKAFKPDLTTEEAYRILKNTGHKVNDSDKVGLVINPLEALKQVQ